MWNAMMAYKANKPLYFIWWWGYSRLSRYWGSLLRNFPQKGFLGVIGDVIWIESECWLSSEACMHESYETEILNVLLYTVFICISRHHFMPLLLVMLMSLAKSYVWIHTSCLLVWIKVCDAFKHSDMIESWMQSSGFESACIPRTRWRTWIKFFRDLSIFSRVSWNANQLSMNCITGVPTFPQ